MDDDDWRTVITDRAASDGALVALAERSDVEPAALAALAADDERLKRTPALAVAIYQNARAPMSVANRAVLTCHRAGVIPDGIPGFEELARAIAAEPGALDPSVADVGFAALIETTRDCPPDEEGGGETEAPIAGARSDAEAKAGRRRSAIIDFSKLKLYEKIRLATLGNGYCRQNLLRDSNRMVAMAAIRSPQITDGEVAQAAGNRALGEEVIRYIANRKELVKQYPVKLALVGNVKCPLAVALRLLPTLHAEDIKRLARSKNVPGALSVAAKRLAAARGPQ